MNENQLNAIKLMQQAPNLFLANYFISLKAEVDFEYISKTDLKEIYLKTIEDIELFENDAYKRYDLYKKSKLHKPNDTYCNELELIEEQLNNNKINRSNIAQILKSLDELKYEFEKIIFSNKTIFFFKDYGEYKTTFLLIIEDEYIRKSIIFNNSNVLTRDILTFQCLKSHIDNGYRNAHDIVKRKRNKFLLKSDVVKYQNTLKVTFMAHQYESVISPPSIYDQLSMIFHSKITILSLDKSINVSSFYKIDSKAFSSLINLKEIV
jgi:hypothetical protein